MVFSAAPVLPLPIVLQSTLASVLSCTYSLFLRHVLFLCTCVIQVPS